MANVTWTLGNTTGDWSSPSDWTGDLVPAAGDAVFIDQSLPGNSYTVRLDATEPTTGSYAALTVGIGEATLALSLASKTLSIAGLTKLSAGTIDISNASTLSTGTFLGNGGTLFASGGLLGITGTATLSSGLIRVFGDSTLSAASLVISGGTLEHFSTVNVAGNAAFNGGTDGQFGGSFSAGTLTVAGGSVDASIGNLTSKGATFLSSGTLGVRNLAALNTDSLAISGGQLSQDDLTSTVNVTGNAVFAGGIDAMSGGAFTAATLTVAGGSINASNGNLRSKGVTDLSSGSITIRLLATLDTDTLTVSGGLIDALGGTITSNGATFLSSGSIAVSGSATLNADSLTISGGALTQDGASTVNVTGNAAFAGGIGGLFGGTFNAGALAVGDGSNAQLLTLEGEATTVDGLTTINKAGRVDLSGGSLSATGGISDLGLLSGSGKVDGGAISGTGTVIAAGGTLDIANKILNGPTLSIGFASNLKLGGTATSAGAINLINATRGLEIGNAGALTINQAQTVTGSTITLDGGALIDASGIAITGGGTIIGAGTVQADLAGLGSAGFVKASGGRLAIDGNLSSSLTTSIDNASTLSLGGSVGSGLIVDYGSNLSAELELNAGALTSFENQGTISGMSVGKGLAPTDVLDLTTINPGSIASAALGNGGKQIELFDNGDTMVASFNLDAPVTGFVHWSADEGSGTDVFLSDTPVCFAAGTRVLTATGERPVETLTQGDIVVTLSGAERNAQPVQWIGRRRIDLTAHPRPETVAPIRIRRGAFADNLPHTDLLVSPDHAILVDGRLICARQLVNGTTIRQEKGCTAVEYFHVELDVHAILLAEGLPAESYLNTGNRGFFANSGEPLALHPDLTDQTDYPTREANSCAPFVRDEGNVWPVWQRLAARAAALHQPAPQLDTTTDADLHIVAKGRTVRPLYGEKGSYIFVLPKDATEVLLISRTGAPADVRPWLDDRRCLGVHVERIVLRGATEVREVPIDHPGLARGWWEVESNGTAMRRWTNGEAVLPLPASQGPTMLEIRASNGGMAYLTATDRACLAA
jgi:hypothetical protein